MERETIIKKVRAINGNLSPVSLKELKKSKADKNKKGKK
jgi:hypothetical protein